MSETQSKIRLEWLREPPIKCFLSPMPAISYNTVSARDVQMLFDPTQKHADTVWLMAFSGTLVFIAITVRVLIVRLEARSFTVSDWLMIISLFPTLVYFILGGLAVSQFSFNKHVSDITTVQFVDAIKLSFVGEVIYSLLSTLVKLAVLFLYLQIAERSVNHTFARLVKATIALVICSTVAYNIALATACRPISAFWFQADPAWVENHNWKCTSQKPFMLSAAVIIAAVDFLVALLPIKFFLQLQVAPRQKFILIVLFAIGSCAGVAATVRVYYVHVTYADVSDWTWNFWYIWNWTAIELAVGSICACAPSFKAFYLYCRSRNGVAGPSRSSQTPTPADRRSSRAGLLSSIRRKSSAISWSQSRLSIVPEVNRFDESPGARASVSPPRMQLLPKFSSFQKRVDLDMQELHHIHPTPVRELSWESGTTVSLGKTTSAARPQPARDSSWRTQDLDPDEMVSWVAMEEEEKQSCVKVKYTVEVTLDSGDTEGVCDL